MIRPEVLAGAHHHLGTDAGYEPAGVTLLTAWATLFTVA